MGGRVLKTGLLTADKLAKPEGPSSEQSLSKFKGAHGISPASAGVRTVCLLLAASDGDFDRLYGM